MKKFYRSSVVTVLLFVIAAVLLFAGSIGGTQAALQYFSSDYQTEIRLKNIGVTLYENTNPVTAATKEISWRDYSKTDANGQWSEHTGNLVETMVQDEGDPSFKVGKDYTFELSVANSGQVNQYVRVTLYKYWVDGNGNKLTGDTRGWFNGVGNKQVKYDPTKIIITPANNALWTVMDETDERMVFYYQGVLPYGDVPVATVPFTSTLRVDSGIMDIVKVTTATNENGAEVTTYEYAYDGLGFVVEAEVDAVQAKNGERSVPSAWGPSVKNVGVVDENVGG